jgi:hypothetical protein
MPCARKFSEVLGSSRKFSEVCGVAGSGENLQSMHNLTTAMPPSRKCAEVLGSDSPGRCQRPPELAWIVQTSNFSFISYDIFHFWQFICVFGKYFIISIDFKLLRRFRYQTFPKRCQRPIISSLLSKISTMSRQNCPVSQASNPSCPIST